MCVREKQREAISLEPPSLLARLEPLLGSPIHEVRWNEARSKFRKAPDTVVRFVYTFHQRVNRLDSAMLGRAGSSSHFPNVLWTTSSPPDSGTIVLFGPVTTHRAFVPCHHGMR